MGRTFLLGALGILVVAGALGAVVWLLTMPGPPQPLAPLDPLPAGAGSAPAPPPAGALPPAAAPRPERPSEARPVGRPPRGPGELFSSLQPLGASVGACTARATPAASSSPRQAILVLEIEPLDGKVKIVGASPWEGGKATDALAHCARSEIVGREVPLASARPGRIYKMPYSIRY